MGFVAEFKEFAMKGNLVDLAVGVVMGAAFGKVTSAFIDKMFMPLVGMLFSVGDLNKFNIELQAAGADAVKNPAVVIGLGEFISALINFIIVAFVMFMIIKGMNKLKKAEPEVAPVTPEDVVLLREIRDSLKK